MRCLRLSHPSAIPTGCQSSSLGGSSSDRRSRHKQQVLMEPHLLAVLVVLSALHTTLAQNATAGALLQQQLTTICNATQLPSPESGSAFMGPLRTATTNLTDFAYYRFGNASSGRPPLLLITGYSGTLRSWGVKALQALARDQEVVVVDNRGQGLSKDLAPAVPLTVEGQANDTLAFINAIGLNRPNVMGWSFGGMIATAMAALHGDELGKVVVISGSAGAPNATAPSPRAIQLATSRRPNASINDLEVASLLFDVNSAAGFMSLCGWLREELLSKQHPSNDTTTARETTAITNYLLRSGVYNLLPNVANPMLLIGGSADELVPAKNLEAMASKLRDATLVIYPGLRHGAWYQNLPAFLDIVNSFLSPQTAAGAPVGAATAVRAAPAMELAAGQAAGLGQSLARRFGQKGSTGA